ncbi:hypothetical protein ROZALSC1DRAFT_24466 [Rozella allomycis CSF55]|uniref:WD40 repeat-like protein n=1 Tax=Rozella allomycis (strain CSF55) TaxID=988480 RepID=A0A4P9YFV0_ROZAC|nr:hypothetical protein ROZALSC1DRAFT_24466 [Rozella allomycis CSF55]
MEENVRPKSSYKPNFNFIKSNETEEAPGEREMEYDSDFESSDQSEENNIVEQKLYNSGSKINLSGLTLCASKSKSIKPHCPFSSYETYIQSISTGRSAQVATQTSEDVVEIGTQTDIYDTKRTGTQTELNHHINIDGFVTLESFVSHFESLFNSNSLKSNTTSPEIESVEEGLIFAQQRKGLQLNVNKDSLIVSIQEIDGFIAVETKNGNEVFLVIYELSGTDSILTILKPATKITAIKILRTCLLSSRLIVAIGTEDGGIYMYSDLNNKDGNAKIPFFRTDIFPSKFDHLCPLVSFIHENGNIKTFDENGNISYFHISSDDQIADEFHTFGTDLKVNLDNQIDIHNILGYRKVVSAFSTIADILIILTNTEEILKIKLNPLNNEKHVLLSHYVFQCQILRVHWQGNMAYLEAKNEIIYIFDFDSFAILHSINIDTSIIYKVLLPAFSIPELSMISISSAKNDNYDISVWNFSTDISIPAFSGNLVLHDVSDVFLLQENKKVYICWCVGTSISIFELNLNLE